MKKAILVVSFGTSHDDTRMRTIDKIEESLQREFPDYKLYRAWTSKMIIRKIKRRDNIVIPTVAEAFEQMVADGITHVLVQPTHVLNGVENDIMIEEAKKFSGQMEKIVFGTPLITSEEDGLECVKIVGEKFLHLDPEEDALVLMGHGSTHYVNTVYAALDYKFKEQGYENIYMGTVEAYPDLDVVMSFLNKRRPKRIVLTPFMIVAGDHAKNDMAGEEEDSWKSVLSEEGFQVECVLKGLGEYEEIQQIFIEHAKEARTKLERM